jgi:1-deoxy-D-xylulose-5-phosphate reductoisomerase
MKTLALFGSTGSIGTSTLDVVRRHPDAFRVRYLTANSRVEALVAQIDEFAPAAVAVADPIAAAAVRSAVGDRIPVLEGINGLLEIARRDDYDTMVSGLVGFAGLLPTVAAIEHGHDIALANKETLVVAGEIISHLLTQHRVRLLPVDSEHSAIFQCLVGEPAESVARLILTASGGPFRGRTRDELAHVTREHALAHPNWSMGQKITIDSATLMNKGLEVIEAHWLFGIPAERIDVMVHPQSIIHSMVEFTDGSVKAQLGVPDMKIPIHYALTAPDRIAATYDRLTLERMRTLTFEAPDTESFPCLRLAYEALAAGGTAPAVLNGANEVAVAAFLAGRIGFLDIPDVIARTLDEIPVTAADSIAAVSDADGAARSTASILISHTRSVTLPAA